MMGDRADTIFRSVRLRPFWQISLPKQNGTYHPPSSVYSYPGNKLSFEHARALKVL
jgi:hypothetical protein